MLDRAGGRNSPPELQDGACQAHEVLGCFTSLHRQAFKRERGKRLMLFQCLKIPPVLLGQEHGALEAQQVQDVCAQTPISFAAIITQLNFLFE